MILFEDKDQCGATLTLEGNEIRCILSTGHRKGFDRFEDHVGHDDANHGRLVTFRLRSNTNGTDH